VCHCTILYRKEVNDERELEYCSSVWSPFSDSGISQIEAIQRRAARWAMRDYSRTSSVTDMLGKLGWRRLELRSIDQRLCMFHGITHSLVAIPSEDYITRNTRPPRTSHDMAYKQIQTSSDFYKFSFFPRTIIHWNSLPANLVNLNATQFSQAVSQIEHVSP